MELKLSNVLNNLDEFFKRQSDLNINTIKKDIKYKNKYINKFLMTQIFKNFYIDIIQQQTYSNNFKKIFDYSEEELLSFRETFKSLNRQSSNDVVLNLYSKNLELFKKPEPINLIEKYINSDRYVNYKNEFNNFKHKISGFTTENIEYSLNVGDIILFKNGYDIEMITEILGFDSDGDCYLLWDCYWSPIKLNERFIKIISKNTNEENTQTNIEKALEQLLTDQPIEFSKCYIITDVPKDTPQRICMQILTQEKSKSFLENKILSLIGNQFDVDILPTSSGGWYIYIGEKELGVDERREFAKQIEKFVSENSSFGCDTDIDDLELSDDLVFSTRENGNIYTELHSDIDLQEAEQLRIKLLKTFTNLQSENIKIDTVDEWVNLEINF